MKIIHLFITVSLFLIHNISYGQEVKIPSVTLKSGKTYTGATLTRKNDATASLIHSSGVTNVPLDELPDAVAKQLGYSKEKAEALKLEKIKAEQALQKELKDALDFKGLRLRMPLNQIPRLINKTLWSYDNIDILLKRIDIKNPNTTLTLDSDDVKERRKNGFTNKQAADFSSVGREGIGDNAFWYYISDTRVQFADAKLAQIKIYGPSWSADKLKTRTLRWLELADIGLRKKYGNPTKIIIPIKKFNILNAESGYIVYLSKWEIRGQTIYIGVSESESEFTPMIVYYDNKLKAKLDLLGAGKSNF